METVIEHTVESTVAAAPPRRVSLPLGTNLLLLAATLLFGLFIYGGSRALVEALKLGWLQATGQTISAKVEAVLTEHAQIKGQPERQVGLRYTYIFPFSAHPTPQTDFARLDTREASDAQRLGDAAPGAKSASASSIPVFHVGDVLPLRCGLWLGRPLVYPWQSAPSGKIAFLILCGGLVIGISALLLRRLLLWRSHRLHLLRFGIATVGTVVHKHAQAEDAPRYYIRYGYAAGPTPREHEEQVSIEQWKRLDIGQPVTVLYDPDRTDDASLYALLGGK